METPAKTPGKFALFYGLLLGFILAFISMIMYATGMQLEGVQWPMYIFYLLFLIAIFFSIHQYKKQNATILTIGDAIKTGLSVALLSALVFAVYNILFNYVIDPGYIDQVMQLSKEKMLENPKMTKEMVEQNMKWVRMFSSPWIMTAVWFALSAFFGLIYSLLAGLIMRNEPPKY